MNNCCCAELVVDEGQQIELNVESDGGIEVGVAEQFVIGGGGNYQSKTVNITPTESAQSQTVQADVGYDALNEVEVNVAAVSDTYVGSAVPRKSSYNVAINGANFVAPAGYYASNAEKTMPTAGWDITATKGAVSNHSVSVTPKAEVFYEGYAQETVRTGTAVSVSASELDSGTKSITSNGNAQDVVGYAAVNVAVPNSYTAGDEGKVVSSGALVSQTSDTVTANGTYDTTLINSLLVNVSGGGGVLTGTYTPASDSNTFSIDVGSSFTEFALFEMVTASGHGFRALRIGICHFTENKILMISTNNSGSSVALEQNYTTGGFTKNGNVVTYSKTNVKAPGGVTYKWFAW